MTAQLDTEALSTEQILFGGKLDGQGGVMLPQDALAEKGSVYWLHLNDAGEDSSNWLATSSLIPDTIRPALIGNNVRPRFEREGDGILITLRCTCHQQGAPEALNGLRVWLTQDTIISTQQDEICVVEDIIALLKQGRGPKNSVEWLTMLCEAIVEKAMGFIEVLHVQVIEMENDLLDQNEVQRGQLARLRKALLVMRRYMAPQREALMRLASEKLDWLPPPARRRLRDIAERLGRGIDDLDASVARTAVLADEMTTLMAESLNKRIYFISILSMIFLPGTFLTGLFGVNLGGIPGGEYPYGFLLFCVLLVVFFAVLIGWLKYYNWLSPRNGQRDKSSTSNR